MSIRRHRIGAGQRDQVVQMVDEGLVDQLRNEPGFLSYHLVAPRPNELISMPAFQDEETLERVVQKSGEWVGTHLTGRRQARGFTHRPSDIAPGLKG